MVVRRASVLGLMATGILAGCYGGGGPKRTIDGSGGPASLSGAPAISYDIPRLGGGSDSVARHRGSVVLMNFWATWCPPCKEEMPALEQLWREFRGRGLVVLGIDQGESPSQVSAFVKRLGISFPILLDSDQQYATSYVSVGLPTSILVSRDGHVLKQFRALVSPARTTS
jgi:peroxiredoxin